MRAAKYIIILGAVLIGAGVSLFLWSSHADQERFRAAKNDCERGCIQDSGGLEGCRKICAGHPDHYP